MKSIFKKLLAEINTPIQDKEVSLTNKETEFDREYPQVVKDIHNAFMNTGDKLLKEAQEMIENTSLKNEEKAQDLSEFGFVKTKEVQHLKEKETLIKESTEIQNAVLEAKRKYPLYKFIPEKQAKEICEKYSLVLGTTNQYKGFVPQKNVEDIKKFYSIYPEDKITYQKIRQSRFNWSFITENISKEEYERIKENKTNLPINIYGDNENVIKQPTILNICAPISDMETEGYKVVQGWKLEKEVPDPIVMIDKTFNNIKGYIIITAWGNEASDPLVVNQDNN